MDGSGLSIVMFSGTDDRLNAAAVLAAGAAAMGRRVNIFLQYWALDAFRTDRITKDHGVSAEAGSAGAELMQRQGGCTGARSSARPRTSVRWRSTRARCRWRCSGSRSRTLDPLVDGQEGVASFFMDVDGPLTFI